VMIISANRDLMGESLNRRLSEVLGWISVGVMTAAAIAMPVVPLGS
jgi:hypothetical protein